MAEEIGHYDSSDPVAVDNAAKESARREAQDDETVRIWMSHPNGRELLYRFLEVCHLYEDCRGLDTHDTYFNLGERNIGNWMLIRMQKHPKLMAEMMEEQRRERDLRNSRLLKQNESKDARDG